MVQKDIETTSLILGFNKILSSEIFKWEKFGSL